MPISFPYRIDPTGRTAVQPDERALVRELVEQVLFTRPGERVMRPTFGSGVQQLVFAPATDEIATIAQHLVRAALQQWLADWIEVHDVQVLAEDARLTITVIYAIRRSGERDQVTLSREV